MFKRVYFLLSQTSLKKAYFYGEYELRAFLVHHLFIVVVLVVGFNHKST